MKLKELINSLESSVVQIKLERTVEDAVNLMANKKKSAVLVMEGDTPRGIFTERDLVRCHTFFPDKPLCMVPLDSVMTSSLVVAELQETLEDAMAMMIRANIRHLPVVEKGRVCAMLGLEDLVRRHVGALTKELHYLKDYISTLQDAVHD
jgi:signal-transduction protein with cAMP-binding, CBS, and nucleotidyltransferase domain